MTVLINSADDMQWLKDVHIPSLPDDARSAIIIGNEDAPDSVEVYDSVNPHIKDRPIMLCSAEYLGWARRQPR
jgi:hypothetical protein